MATKFKTVKAVVPVRRMVMEGVLKVNSVDEDKNYKVSLMLLNGKRNRNGWVYLNLEKNLGQFVNIPILCAWVQGKPDGHNFDIKIDKKTGKEYASFVGADAEKIIGWVIEKTPSGEDNAYIANIDGVDWVCIREAFIPSFYNKEFIDALEAEGGQMKVSIETLVSKSYVEGDTEYEEEWTVVGITVISVTEAVAGANIKRKVNAEYGEELEKIKLRASQYYAKTNIKEPQTQKQNQVKENKKSMKVMNLEDLKSKFNGYTPLKVNGLTVALLSDTGRLCTYTFLENEDTVVPERIEEVAVNSVFGEGDNAVTVSGAEFVGVLTSKLNAATRALEDETKKHAEDNATLTAKLNKMIEAETKRRKEAVKAAIKAQLQANQKDCGVEIADNLCDDLLTDDCIGKYAEMVGANDCFNGDEVARKDVDARCMAEVRKGNQAKEQQRKANQGYHWNMAIPKEDDTVSGVLASLQNIQK